MLSVPRCGFISAASPRCSLFSHEFYGGDQNADESDCRFAALKDGAEAERSVGRETERDRQ